VTPGSRIIEASQGRIPLELVFDSRHDASYRPSRETARSSGARPHDQVFGTWSWTCDRALSLPRLRATLEGLPESVYRCKGVVQIEELPIYRYVLQMVGKRYHLEESGSWGEDTPGSEIVLIGGHDGIDAERLQRAFDACVGTGDESQSAVLRLVRKIAPNLLDVDA
jgi:G3E family GTPase